MRIIQPVLNVVNDSFTNYIQDFITRFLGLTVGLYALGAGFYYFITKALNIEFIPVTSFALLLAFYLLATFIKDIALTCWANSKAVQIEE